MKKSTYSIFAALLTASMFTGCGLLGTQASVSGEDVPALLTPIDVPVNTAEVAYRDIAISSYYEATVVPYVEEYAFPISGTITEQHYQIGDMVNAGDLLTEIRHESIDTRIASLESRIASETASFTLVNEKYRLTIESLKQERSKLSKSETGKKAVIDCDIEIYETKIRQNEENLATKLEPLTLELEELKELHPDYFIYAPMSGQVVYVESKNSSVTPKNTAIGVADLTTKYLQTSGIDEWLIQSADRVYVMYGEETYNLRYVPYVYDSSSGRLVNRGRNFSNFTLSDSTISDDILNFGDHALIVIETDYISNVLTVPNTALNTDSIGTYVYLISQSGAKVRQDIVVGNTNSIYTVVIDGLKEGDLVYVPN